MAISSSRGEEADEGQAAAGAAAGSGSRGSEGGSSPSSSSPRSTPSSQQTLAALDQLLGIEAKPAGQQPPPLPPQREERLPAAPQALRPGEPQLTFYDPSEEAEWKYKTRCILVAVVGGTAVLLSMVLPVAMFWVIRHGIPLDRLGDLARMKQGECLELPQERMVCRRELDNFKL